MRNVCGDNKIIYYYYHLENCYNTWFSFKQRNVGAVKLLYAL